MTPEQAEYLEAFAATARAVRHVSFRRDGWADGAHLKAHTSHILHESPVLGPSDYGRRDAWLVAWGF